MTRPMTGFMAPLALSLVLVAASAAVPVLAAGGGGGGGGGGGADAGDIMTGKPPPPPAGQSNTTTTTRSIQKSKKDKQSFLEDSSFIEGYRAAYATIYERNDYTSAIAQLRALGHDDYANVANLI